MTERWAVLGRIGSSRYAVASEGRVRSWETGDLLATYQHGQHRRVRLWFPPSNQHPFGHRRWFRVDRLMHEAGLDR